MDNAQKAIMIGVGLFITIIIISAVLLITNLGTGLIGNAQGQLSNISKALQNQVTAAYDGKTMTGAEVIAAVQQYENSEMSITIKYGTATTQEEFTGKYKIATANLADAKTDGKALVATKSYPGGVYFNGTLTELAAAEKTNVTKLQSTSVGVSAVKTYYSSIVKDATTDTVLGVVFVQK